MTTLKELIVKAYAIYACNPNKVYFLNKYKGRYSWQTVEKMKDCGNMWCVVKSKESEDLLVEILPNLLERYKACYIDENQNGDKIVIPKVPKDADTIQVVEFVPTMEDGKIWDEAIKWYDLEIRDNNDL